MQTLEAPTGTSLLLRLPEIDLVSLQTVASQEDEFTVDDSVRHLTELGIDLYLRRPANIMAYKQTDADPLNTTFSEPATGKRVADLSIVNGIDLPVFLPNYVVVSARRIHDVEITRTTPAFGVQSDYLGASDIIRGLVHMGIAVYNESPCHETKAESVSKERTFALQLYMCKIASASRVII